MSGVSQPEINPAAAAAVNLALSGCSCFHFFLPPLAVAPRGQLAECGSQGWIVQCGHLEGLVDREAPAPSCSTARRRTGEETALSDRSWMNRPSSCTDLDEYENGSLVPVPCPKLVGLVGLLEDLMDSCGMYPGSMLLSGTGGAGGALLLLLAEEGPLDCGLDEDALEDSESFLALW